MNAHERKYIREYYRARRAKLRAAAPDPESHPLRVWRKAMGLTAAQAGELLDVHVSCVRNWETGCDLTPEWVFEVISEDMNQYCQHKIRSLLHKEEKSCTKSK